MKVRMQAVGLSDPHDLVGIPLLDEPGCGKQIGTIIEAILDEDDWYNLKIEVDLKVLNEYMNRDIYKNVSVGMR